MREPLLSLHNDNCDSFSLFNAHVLMQSYLPLGNFKLRWNTIQSILKMPTAFNLAELTQERAFLYAGILMVSLMGSFVIWGPTPKRLTGSKKSRGKQEHI
jgi:hypothetical protein